MAGHPLNQAHEPFIDFLVSCRSVPRESISPNKQNFEEYPMLKMTGIAKAVSLAISGTTLFLGVVNASNAAVTTMYNMSTAGGADIYGNTTNPTAGGVWGLWQGGTDGWTNGAYPTPFNSTVGEGANQKWVGTSGLTTPAFNYTGAHLNWGFEITGGNGGSGQISTFDAFARYGMYADVDTAKGAWAATNTGASFGGWRHDLDTGLFKSDTSGTVTLSVTGILQPNSNYGFTIFKGIDTVTTYSHHGQWNNNNNSFAPPTNSQSSPYVDPGALTPSNIVAYSVGSFAGSPTVNINTIQFEAEAGQYYTIFLGGYRNGDWTTTVDGYTLSVSQVPVPAAVWLFGSALAGLGVIGRRKSKPSV